MTGGHLLAKLITDLGDAAFLLPASALVLGYLWALKSGRAAAAWMSTLALCAGLTVLAKLAFYACGAQFPALDIRSPSGHTSLSTTFYSCGAMMLSVEKDRLAKLVIAAASALVIAAIALSRLLLHVHTSEEVMAGLIIGLVCVAWFAFAYLRERTGSLPWPWLAATLILLALLTHGWHLDLEMLLAHLARQLHLFVNACA